MEAKKICVSRFTLATLICVFVQYILSAVTLLIVNTSPFTPISWIFSSLSNAFSLYSLLYAIPLVFVVFGNGVMLTDKFLSARKSGRIGNGIKKLIKLGFQLVTALLLAWIYLRFLTPRYSAFRNKEDGEVNQRCVFLILAGIYAGVHYFMKKGIKETLAFPVIQQSKYSKIKAHLYKNVWDSFLDTIFPTLTCCVLIGGCMGAWTKTFDLSFLLEIRLICYTWLLFAHINCSLLMYRSVFEVVFTDCIEFPIERQSIVAVDTSLTLAEALQSNKFPLIQLLAAQDLYNLSDDYNATRRRQLYALSIIGGHPYSWKHISDAGLSVLKLFVNNLNQILNEKQPSSISKPITNNNIFASPMQDEKYAQRQMNETMGIRNLLASPFTSPAPLQHINSTIDKTILSPKNLKSNLQSTVSNNFCVRLFFGEDKSKKVNQILEQHYQEVTWVSQALAALAGYSLNEDKYGVVQDSLPNIIKTLLDLYHALEKISSSNLVIKKVNRNYFAVRQASKRSLYRILKDFQKYLNDLVLDANTLDSLRSFTM